VTAGVGEVLVSIAAGAAVLLAVHPGPRARRFPEDAECSVVRGGTLPSRPRVRRPPTLRRRRRAPEDPGDLAECCDLLAVAAGSGLNVAEAIRAVGAVSSGPVGTMLGSVAAEVDGGGLLVEVLARRGGSVAASVRPLLTTLVTTAVSGAPVAPALQRLADSERRRTRRRAEARIRRLPVLLLLPLVCLVLPAFVLLTLVPVGLATAADAGILTSAPDRPVTAVPRTSGSTDPPDPTIASPDPPSVAPPGGRP